MYGLVFILVGLKVRVAYVKYEKFFTMQFYTAADWL